ncbi:MAG: ribosome biogenesis factor YjgA [Burkholderiales bacterium]
MAPPRSPTPPADRPSKTQRKREMHELQALGERIVAVGETRLDAMELPERLREAVVAAHRISSHEGRRRQLQYIGRLMREVDPEPIRARLDAWQNAAATHAAEHRRAEAWRERLLSDDPAALSELLIACPAIDEPRLRALVRDARHERAQAQPPRRFRELFRFVKAAFEMAVADAASL